MIEYICPHCDALIEIDANDVNLDEDFLCSACGKPAFPDILPKGKE